MTRIDDLVARLCPTGVEFRALGEVGEVFRGRRFTKADYVEDGLAAIHYGELYTHFGTSATDVITRVRPDLAPNLRFADPGDVVVAEVGETVEAVGKAVAWLGAERVAIHDGCYGFRSDLNPLFVSYLLQTQRFHAEKSPYVARAKVKRLSIEGLRTFRIPLPPAEVQAEVVRVLELFQSLTEELESELEAELEARRLQVAHHRSLLLRSDQPPSTIGAVCTRVSAGGTPLSTRREYYDGGTIPWLRTQEVRYSDIHDTAVKITEAGLANSSAKWVPAGSVIVAISGAGATRGRAAMNRVPVTTNQHCCSLQIDPDQADARYVFHWVTENYAALRSLGQGNRSDLNLSIIKGFHIPLPPVREQECIAATLDKLDLLMNGLSGELPSELAARRKQFSYHRDRLLAFTGAG